MRTTTKGVGRLVAVFLLCCGVGCGGGGGGGDGQDGTVSLVQTEAVPTQVITVRDSRLAPGDVVEVLFQNTAGASPSFLTSAHGVAIDAGEVEVATPTALDPTTGTPTTMDLLVSINGVSAPRRLRVEPPMALDVDTQGEVLAGLWDHMLNQVEGLYVRLIELRQMEGADVEAIDAEIDEALAEFDRLIALRAEFDSTGTVVLQTEDGPITLDADDLTRVDELILATLVSQQAHRDAIEATLDTKFGAPIQQKGTVSLDRIFANWRRSLDAVSDAEEGDGVRRWAREQWEVSLPRFQRDASQGLKRFGQYLTTVFSGARVMGDRNLRRVANSLSHLQLAVTTLATWAATEAKERAATGGAELRASFDGIKAEALALGRLLVSFGSKLDDESFTQRVSTLLSQLDSATKVIDAATNYQCTNGDGANPLCATRSGAIGNITGLGFASASSQFNSDFSVRNATDGNSATNWFSNGSRDNNLELLEWNYTGTGDIPVFRIETDAETFRDNDPDTNDNFGFRVVIIQVFNAANAKVYESDAIVPPGGRVNIRHALPAGIRAKRVTLQLIDHVQADCGGVSEFRIIGQSN